LVVRLARSTNRPLIEHRVIMAALVVMAKRRGREPEI
jgi:hypothetical protein